MNPILADVFAMYLKTKNFHWHMSGPHFRDYHLLLDEQAAQLLAMTDQIAERLRKIGASTLHSVGHVSRLQRVKDNDAQFVGPFDMLVELMNDNASLAARLRDAHELCDRHRDIATASLIEVWLDETENRTWFLFEATRSPNQCASGALRSTICEMNDSGIEPSMSERMITVRWRLGALTPPATGV